ncbi:MAG: hypothetical protein JWQ22_2070 [Devosia sp.]|nr:hypothetical protein [Devosia sp.]
MKFVQIIATAAILVAGATAANASVFNMQTGAFSDISLATNATVQTVTNNEAKLLSYDNDVQSVRARVQGNQWLVQNIERQGFSVDQIVGFTGGANDLTLYAL